MIVCMLFLIPWYLTEHKPLSMIISLTCLFLLCRYKITTEKPMGAIAGIQRVEGGQIEWSYHLPHSCQLSQYVNSSTCTNE